MLNSLVCHIQKLFGNQCRVDGKKIRDHFGHNLGNISRLGIISGAVQTYTTLARITVVILEDLKDPFKI